MDENKEIKEQEDNNKPTKSQKLKMIFVLIIAVLSSICSIIYTLTYSYSLWTGGFRPSLDMLAPRRMVWVIPMCYLLFKVIMNYKKCCSEKDIDNSLKESFYNIAILSIAVSILSLVAAISGPFYF